MSKDVSFRKATMDDLDRISEIYEMIHDLEEQGKITVGWIRGVYPTRDTAQAAIRADEMFVEEFDGRIVASGKINQSQENSYAGGDWRYDVPNDQVMVLHTLTVAPDEGKHGFGTRFAAFYEQYALDHGCPYLRIDTNARNARARALYAKLGYTEVGIVPTVFNNIPDVQLVLLEKKAVAER
ncbi:Predicted acetyltransferase [Slackia heliotrinireducens]|uniref:Acetyltransferase, ribosomal protein N-acetylase n=1 Tax=Slackia heliotrinireducens (strain ATCC 29202 / DSM 20476 / NCTC 11029 / RHS 1) TaxID=471855 RepID=C7N7B8_SLAHD|nr:GNAT family N-acetyltransferase [Slackia heliotrinireducens]ACV22803.1 acetyltransferase, ribosomal protein N-acetylase [Slackia heliotrinireducens DSM 20476]VEH01508.1 Predicted acetyltransferase [Slackia heliotrinireducens]